jgi:amino acid adenylation domain-containing protein
MQATGLQGSPLSVQQNRLWSWQGNDQGYCTTCAIEIQGLLEYDRFKQALEHVIERHEILRTVFYSLPGMDIPVQVVSDRVLWSYTEISLEQLTASEQYVKIEELFASTKEEMHDMLHGPLLLARLLCLDINRQVLLVSLSSLCADSYSLKLFVDELLNTYTNHPPVEEVLQYADVSAWQDEQLLEAESLPQREYWRKIELSQITDMKLPFRTSEVRANGAFAPQSVEIEISDTLAQKIEAQAQQYNVSVFAWLFASWQVLLWRLTNETAFLIGVACDGRNYEELVNALGPYTRFVPVEARFEKDRSFALVLASVNASLQEAVKRQLYFTWDAISDYAKDDATRHFFPVVFEYDVWPATLGRGALTLSLLKHWSCMEPFALKLSALQVGARMQLSLHYDSQQMTKAQVSSLAKLCRTLLEQVTEQPETLIGTISLLSAEERAYLFTTFSGPRCVWPEQSLHRLFEVQVQRQPDAPAVVSRQEQLTYQQLNIQANQLAEVLRRRGVGPNVVVGLCFSRQASMLVGLLGILKAGGAYLPLDVSSPKARLLYQLQESGARLLLTHEEQRRHLPDWAGNTLYLEDLAEELAESSPEDQSVGNQGECLAYVIYTSGSTGVPKGVMISQRSVVNYAMAICEQLGAEPGWHYATVSTLAADLGNTAIFGALASGGCVQVLDYEQVTSAEAMASWAELHPIDVLKIVPSHLSALLESERGRVFLPRQALVLGGEVLPERLLDRVRELGGGCAVYNHYGPTETTIGVLVNALGVWRGKKGMGEERQIALGCPIANMQVYVLDGRMQMVPPGVWGELYIGGSGVAWGYVGQGDQTAERFVPNPYSEEEGARLYRTGDLAKYADGGQIEFMGRVDGQMKLRGYRVEASEIEAVLRQHPQVRESMVALWRDEGGEPQLVGYVVSRQRMYIAHEQLEAYVRERLPEYMVPGKYVCLEAWPLTANGKVDRRRLPKPESEHGMSLTKREIAEARSPIEEQIVQIWRDLLGMKIGIHDNFFAMGGHSLLATRLIARIRAVLQVELPVRAVFEAPTVAALAQRVEQALRKVEGIQLPPFEAGIRPEEIPLSFAQQRLWFLDQLEPGSTAYLAARSLRVEGTLDEHALEWSLQELVRRHESLRTSFVERAGRLVQVIQTVGYASLPVIDLQTLGQEQKEEEARRLALQEAQRPCNLTLGPLLRTYLLRLEPQVHVMLLTLHHIITDGWSNEVLVRELATLYQAFVSGLPSPLAPLPIQYADYALWQREWLRGEILESQIAYWRKQLADIPSLGLPTDYPRLPRHTYQGATLSLELPETLSQSLIALSQQEDVTLFMLLLTAFQVLLMRYTGQTDISVGTPIANRTQAEVENVIGFFVNMLVMRVDLSGNPTFLQLLQQVHETCLEAYAHQDVPFEKLMEVLQPEREVSRFSLFQVSFQFAHEIVLSQLIPGLVIESFVTDGASADYDLRLMVTRGPRSFNCVAFYDRNLFEVQTIRRFLEHFQILLQGIVLTPEKPVALLPLLSEQERHLQLIEWNETQRDYPRELCVHQLFEQQVLQTPDAVALVFEEKVLTYAQLNQRANQLARYLQELGVGPEVLVGLYLERSLQMVVALLAVLKAGGAYVPLDTSYPGERLTYMLEEAQVLVVVTTAAQQADHKLAVAQARVVCLDRDWSRIDRYGSENRQSGVQTENLAYVIYTSGSTGRPKGVMISHRGLTNYLWWAIRKYRAAEGTGALLHSSIGFDLTVTSLFVPLITGQRIVIVPEEPGIEPLGLALRHERNLSLVKVTPSHLEGLNHYLPAEELVDGPQVLILGGEALWNKHLTFWQTYSSRTRLINEYGPTETVVGCCAYEVARGATHEGAISIGRPIANMQMYVLDAMLQPTVIGAPGELYIGGRGVARGYWGHPEMTAERFIPHPFSHTPGERLYRTGDLARYLPDGNLEYLGRVDLQVKLQGFRIELGEIEAVLQDHPFVQKAVVIVREDRPGDRRLVAYIIPEMFQSEVASQDVQVPLIAERLKHWQELYDETYQQQPLLNNQTFNIVGWNSSYTGQPIAAEEMQGWLEDTLALVRSYHPERIWEIGCGTGLLLFPLAPTSTHYYGTDFSAVVLEGVRQRLAYCKEEWGIQPAVTLLHQQANDFSAFPKEQIDTVLINSVIQYFPNVDYLLDVLEGAVRLVAPGGRIIVGDVRSLPLLEAFHADVQLSQAPDTMTRQQLWRQVRQHLQQEKELVLDPTFFWRWAETTGRVHRVEVRLKRGRYHNELTQFRYQVVLHIGEPLAASGSVRPPIERVEELNWSEQALTRADVRRKLREDRPSRLRLRQVPNARVEIAVQTLQWLKGWCGPETVEQWRAELHTRTNFGVEPEDLWEDAEQLGYHMTINWGQHTGNGSYSVLLQRKECEQWSDPEEEVHWPTRKGEFANDWHRYANQPLAGDIERLLLPQIRQYLREQLPDYMIPASLELLDVLPLNSNGKLDRRGLPAPQFDQTEELTVLDRPGTPIEELIAGLWSEILGRGPIGVHKNFFELGGHSLLVTQLVARIRATLEIEMPVRVAFEAPTIAEMARWVEQALRKSEVLDMPPLLANAYPEEIPLSFAQQRLWFLEQLTPNSTTYLSFAMLLFRGPLNSRALERSIQEIVHRHENLRTTFMMRTEQPVQVIQPVGQFILPIIDLRNLRPEQRSEAVRVLSQQESQRPCDLAVGPLFRIYLLQLDLQEHMMLLTLHHIITDGWSQEVLVREVNTLYRAYVAERPSPLAPLPIQYAHYALWQRQWLQGEMLQKHIAYWQQQLQGVPSLELPLDAPRTAIQHADGARYAFTLSSDLSADLVSLSRREGVTIFMTLLAAFQVLLYRLSGQTDIVVGTDVANRIHAETEGLIGFFVNLVALRTRLQGSSSFRAVIQQVRGMVLDVYAHQELPFELVVEHVQVERKEYQTPIVQVLCVMQNTPKSTFSLPDIELEVINREDASARFDLALFLQEEMQGIRGAVVYRAGLFKEQTIAAWMRQFEVLLQSIVAKPDMPIDMLEISTDEQKAELIKKKAVKSALEAKRIRSAKSRGFEIR